MRPVVWIVGALESVFALGLLAIGVLMCTIWIKAVGVGAVLAFGGMLLVTAAVCVLAGAMRSGALGPVVGLPLAGLLTCGGLAVQYYLLWEIWRLGTIQGIWRALLWRIFGT